MSDCKKTIVMHRVSLKILFPEGVSPGEMRASNLLRISRDGLDRPVLRGSALAGALRDAYRRMKEAEGEDGTVEYWFGKGLEVEEAEWGSLIQVPDVVLDAGDQEPIVRTHIAVDRHSGAARRGSLFNVESLPPGTSASIVLWIRESLGSTEESRGRRFCEDLAALFGRGLYLGGNKARGIGRTEVKQLFYRKFRCENLSEHAAYLNERHSWTAGKTLLDGEELSLEVPDSERELRIQVMVAIPKGEDLLVADGVGIDFGAEPQRVQDANGELRWRIPGSAIRGPFRAWINRLAARGGHPVSDVHSRLQKDSSASGDEIAWGFEEGERRQAIVRQLERDPATLEEHVECPVLRLFGSGYSKGRIHIADLISSDLADERANLQTRKHVAVDRFTGGAREGALFDNQVLLSPGFFELEIQISDPSQEEARWINSTLMAMHHGILRIGTSKAGGFLKLAGPMKVVGPHAELFEQKPEEIEI